MEDAVVCKSFPVIQSPGSAPVLKMGDINLDKPPYDQGTYMGRAKHFLRLTNPINAFASNAELEEAKRIVTEFRKSRKMPAGYNADKLWATKYLYDSAFHPDTGEKMIVLGRMSAQAPMNTIITGSRLQRWVPILIKARLQRWIPLLIKARLQKQLIASYCAACGGALSTALFLNSKVKNMNPIYARLVPFAAVCGANFINIPMMRSGELINGTPVFTADNTRVGESKAAARYGIGLVCISRVLMALPGMTVTPIITNIAINKGVFCRRPSMVVPFQLFLVGLCVTFATPMCCAIFEQRASISVDRLDEELKDEWTAASANVVTSSSCSWWGTFARTLCYAIFEKHASISVDSLYEDEWTAALAMVVTRSSCSWWGTFARTLCCAIFEKRASISVDSLDEDEWTAAPAMVVTRSNIQSKRATSSLLLPAVACTGSLTRTKVKKNYPKTKEVYFNKGL
ncbi:jg1275 [Pararge aegeria aegeria]|uniref:Jg1275 protein n=1 Tax=Pararge aegeria aegeria TaxID=348720 RepID=A0A8S4S9N9_9NEOP|nr:jg1275 [Pararge aegeria aegeria]